MTIRLLISDVDGTLVTSDKRVTPAAQAAVARLGAADIAFTVTSSRPPVGLRMLVEPLGLALPLGAFNGGTVVAPDMTVIEETCIPAAAAAAAVALLAREGVDVWVFADGRWLLTDPSGHYVAKEGRTIQAEPTVVADFGAALSRAGKIVGSSADFAHLARCEAMLREALGGTAQAVRSQHYYLDVTPPGIDKGVFVRDTARRLGLATSEIAVIGDMDNDVPMFRTAGLSIAMGNATDTVKGEADYVTSSNEEDGFAAAVDRVILGGT